MKRAVCSALPTALIRLLPVALFLPLLLLVGCAGPKGPTPTTDITRLQAEQQTSAANPNISDINQRLLVFSGHPVPVGEYVIGPGDLLQIKIFEAPQLNTDTRVGPDGSITLPLIGKLTIADLSPRNAEVHIADHYRQKYIQSPHVSVFVTEQQQSKITLLGAMNKPGSYQYYATMSLLDVLALGEGLSDLAGSTVQIKRKDGQETRTLIVDIDMMIRQGHDELNVAIRGGDIVYVPEAGTVYVDGAVKRGGTYPIRHEMSVQEAIVAAGGLTSLADTKSIKLIRSLADGRREVAEISLQDMRAGEAARLRVQDRDVLFVEYSTANTIFQALRLNIGTGLLGLGFVPTER